MFFSGLDNTLPLVNEDLPHVLRLRLTACEQLLGGLGREFLSALFQMRQQFLNVLGSRHLQPLLHRASDGMPRLRQERGFQQINRLEFGLTSIRTQRLFAL